MQLSRNIFRKTTVLLATLFCITITGCNDRATSKVKNTLGMTSKAPNENSVISYQPLIVPPTLNSNDLNTIYGENNNPNSCDNTITKSQIITKTKAK